MSLEQNGLPLANEHKRPSSIDLTLELEHQLENDCEGPFSRSSDRPQSLDPHILASIIMQLRHSLSEVSRERDQLLRHLSEAQSQQSHLKTTVEQLETECTHAQAELEIARRKIADDETAIAMLRTKVEESRRGVMRLQTENRRMSQASLAIDVSRASLPIIGGPPSSKRASFTPLTGTGASLPIGHRRMSSFSDSAVCKETATSQFLPLSEHGSRHHAGFSRQLDLPPEIIPVEIECLRNELKSAKEELEETRRELSDAKEAREASETCVKALREFIEENNVGPHPQSESVILPPSTTEEAESKMNGIGWAFKLWKAEPPVKQVPKSHSSVPTVPASTPLSRKFGEFFSSRATIPSNTSATSAPSVTSGQESIYPEGSDGSSVDESVPEPISPTGGEGVATGIVVRESMFSSPELDGGPELVQKKDDPPVEEIDLS